MSGHRQVPTSRNSCLRLARRRHRKISGGYAASISAESCEAVGEKNFERVSSEFFCGGGEEWAAPRRPVRQGSLPRREVRDRTLGVGLWVWCAALPARESSGQASLAWSSAGTGVIALAARPCLAMVCVGSNRGRSGPGSPSGRSVIGFRAVWDLIPSALACVCLRFRGLARLFRCFSGVTHLGPGLGVAANPHRAQSVFPVVCWLFPRACADVFCCQCRRAPEFLGVEHFFRAE